MTLPSALETQVENFISRLKRRQVIGSYEVAEETAIILRQAVSTTRWKDVDILLDMITEIGGRLAAAQPKELAVGNIVRRVLKVIREVARDELETDDMIERENRDDSGDDDAFSSFEDDEPANAKNLSTTSSQVGSVGERQHVTAQSSMFRLLADVSVRNDEPTSEVPEKKSSYNLKPLIIQEINEEIIKDLKSVYEGISDQAVDYIHANEVIMTIGKSRTVEKFLRRAAEKRKFQVIVAETSPTYQGHEMAAALSKAGIDTTVIVDSAIFAAMPRVNKVVLGSHAVLANGGLVAVTGSHLLAAAAKHHSTPVLVCTALYKLSPLFAYDADTFNVTVAPNSVLDFQQGPIIDKVTVSNPYYDYVAPELVSLFVHNLGSAPPTYVYRLINDNYDPEDTTL
ncbi:Translation initiation factor eIF-2B subunit beta [Apophysomyces sp. BC1034]|nr:Translation initiation factor eIF-2B subunit beta [Apophysomyces sp. BC1015]KAG0179749.1 Translation initiation factor eIF-2B subunit beta [Apophysomyces sp. BC1021]KAG0190288.1 Translation initiation factor eIF-2B subunit beta [Apophysomyces sp. BC1034]